MFAQQFQRATLIDLIGGKRRANAARLPNLRHASGMVYPGTSVAIWSTDPTETANVLPHLIVTPDGEAQALLSWIMTYAPALRPFTAYCRIIELEEFNARARAWREPVLSRVDTSIVGGIIGEILSYQFASERLARGDLTASAFQSSLLYALAREHALCGAAMPAADLAQRWLRSRSLTQQPNRGVPADDIAEIAMFLQGLTKEPATAPRSRDDLFSRLGRELFEGGAVLDTLIPGVNEDALISGTREERVVAFERISKSLAASDAPSQEGSFMVGYIASRIFPGSLRHASLVTPLLERFKTSLIWFGVCAGFQPETHVLDEYGGIGRRTLRDLLMPEALVGSPQCDIAIMELDALLTGDRRIEDFTHGNPYYLVVELAPGVYSSVNWPTKRRHPATENTGGNTEKSHRIARELITRDLEAMRRQLGEIIRALGGEPSSASSYEDLFGALSSKRGRKK
ncbi:hypothetical protein [Archangium sp. Cb G35]|uniref:hypothetical protein n=1 Tax=Archangium sp. Cb G35 TaxID=1920190 RepID=UPI000AA4FF17|nr:hypothetical protein [Archangium sp. Cb G35]